MKPDEKSIQVGSLNWFYREANPSNSNNRSPVILLHGLPAQSYSWREVMPALAEKGLRAIAPDWIGFGFSDNPDKRHFAYTPDAFLDAFAALLQALEIEQFSLVVQGFVGSVGLQYALRNPDRIERLAILNTPITSDAKLPWKIKQLSLPFIGDVMTQDPLLVDRTLEGAGPYQVADADLDIYRRPFLRSSAAGRALMATIRNLQLPQVTTEIEAGLKQWQHPTLLIWGEDDPWLPVSMAQTTLNALSNGELAKLEKVGHYAQEDWHEKVNEVLVPFLRRQEKD